MADYWIRDREGRVLGPVSLQVLLDLVDAGRIKEVAAISLDGRLFTALAEVPGLLDLMAAPLPTASGQAAQDLAQAQKLRAQLAQLRTLPDSEVFKVAEGASPEVYRTAFFALAKKFHPDRVPEGFPQLRAACSETFRFLSERVNARISAAKLPAARPRPLDASQFVGLERVAPGRYEATVRITRESVSLFTRHAVVNLKSGGLFVPGRVAPLGAQVDLLLHFVEPSRDIKAFGRVVWENALDTRQPVGFGVRYQQLGEDDEEFIRQYVAGARH